MIQLANGRLRLLALLCTLALAACGKSGTEAPGEHPPIGAPQRGGSFIMAQDSPGVLDPARLDDSYEAAIVNQLFDGLLAFDENLNTTPCLAESWTISEDGLVYVLNLKSDVHFHDGSKLTADDVVFSLSRVFRLDPEKSVLAREYLSHIDGTREYANGETETVSGLEEIDEHTVRIRLRQPYASFLSVLASEMARIVPRAYVEQVGDQAFGRSPVGSGPFALGEWSEGTRIVLTRFPEYHGSVAQIDSVVIELPDVGHRDYSVEQFLAGEISGIEVPHDRLHEFQSNPKIQVRMRQELSLNYMALNLNRPPFNNRLVRQAFLHAIDQTALCAAFEGGRMPPSGVLPPGMPGFDPEKKLPASDPQAARELLVRAGYPGGEGLPTIVHATANESKSERALHEKLSQQLRDVGFSIETVYLNWLEFDERIRNGEFHTYSLTWVADLPDPASILDPLFHSQGSNNLHRYSNDRVDMLLDTARVARSNQRRWELYRTAEKLVLSEAPIVPLYHAMAIIAVQRDVQGLAITPLGVGALAMEQIWFDTPREAAR